MKLAVPSDQSTCASLGLVVIEMSSTTLRFDLPEPPIRREDQIWQILHIFHLRLRRRLNNEVR